MILTKNIQLNKGENAADFIKAVQNVAAKLSINPDWLMMVMYMESKINAQAVNKQSGDSHDPKLRVANRATGLIQFMPKTAVGLSTTTTALYNMTAIKQLDYVYAYFKPFAGKLKSFADLYMVTFFPAAIGKPNTYILQTSKIAASTIAKQNPIFDVNKDQKVTVGEFKSKIQANIPETVYAQVMQSFEKKNTSMV
jgi:hypothetical protein